MMIIIYYFVVVKGVVILVLIVKGMVTCVLNVLIRRYYIKENVSIVKIY